MKSVFFLKGVFFFTSRNGRTATVWLILCPQPCSSVERRGAHADASATSRAADARCTAKRQAQPVVGGIAIDVVLHVVAARARRTGRCIVYLAFPSIFTDDGREQSEVQEISISVSCPVAALEISERGKIVNFCFRWSITFFFKLYKTKSFFGCIISLYKKFEI